MRAEWKKWETLTNTLLHLTTIREEERRDEVIEQIEGVLEKRGELQKQLGAPETEEEREYVRSLLPLERQMTEQLDAFMSLIRQNITQAKTKKGHVKEYINPYGKVARDGTYYDTKQ